MLSVDAFLMLFLKKKIPFCSHFQLATFCTLNLDIAQRIDPEMTKKKVSKYENMNLNFCFEK